jgi:serine protease Do
MSIATNLLRGKRIRLSIAAVAASTALLTTGFLAFHPAKAAFASSAAVSPSAPLDDNSVAALTSLDHAVEAVAARVTPAVVNIAVTAREPEQAQGQDGGGQGGDPMEQFRQFFGPGFGQGSGPEQQQQQRQIEHGIGSGIIVSPDGYIVTNDHVVNGAIEIRVTLHDRRTFPAKVVGVDKLTDLAVIKIDGNNLPWLSWGDSTKLHPGQTVLAFGSPFGYFQFSVTRGIVSALNRPNPDSNDPRKPGGYIQTDAAINPGNSGGPLVDAEGEVVGINTFLISDSGSFAGAGFAIPSQIARSVTEQIIKTGKVEHGYLGIGINDVTPDNAKFFNLSTDNGAVVTQVASDSPAGRAGLKVGDVITSINGQEISNAGDLQIVVGDSTPNTPIKLRVIRDGSPQNVSVTLGELNDNQQTADNRGASEQGGARLGISIGNLTSDIRQQLNLPGGTQGVVVEQVQQGSPAEDAGIANGDVITNVDRQPVTSAEQFRQELEKQPAGKDVLLLVWSNGGASYRVVHTAPTASGM